MGHTKSVQDTLTLSTHFLYTFIIYYTLLVIHTHHPSPPPPRRQQASCDMCIHVQLYTCTCMCTRNKSHIYIYMYIVEWKAKAMAVITYITHMWHKSSEVLVSVRTNQCRPHVRVHYYSYSYTHFCNAQNRRCARSVCSLSTHIHGPPVPPATRKVETAEGTSDPFTAFPVQSTGRAEVSLLEVSPARPPASQRRQ